MKTKEIYIKDIKVVGYNPRKIKKKAFEALERSIEKFGFLQPIIVNERNNCVVGGHQRLKVLEKTGAEKTAVVLVNLAEQIVFDAFSGARSTLLACENLDRKFYGTELEPKYCGRTIKRWKDRTGGIVKVNNEIISW